METNGHFPLACVSAEGLAVKLRMKVLHLNASQHITRFYFGMCQNSPRVASAEPLPIISLIILINVWENEIQAQFRVCKSETPLRSSAVFTLDHSDGTLTHHFTSCPSIKNEVMWFLILFYYSALLSSSPTCLCLLEQRKPLPATYTIT